MADARTEEMERTFGMDLSPQRKAHLQALIDAHHLGADLAHCAIDGCSAAWPCGPRFNAEHELYTIGVMRSITGDRPADVLSSLCARNSFMTRLVVGSSDGIRTGRIWPSGSAVQPQTIPCPADPRSSRAFSAPAAPPSPECLNSHRASSDQRSMAASYPASARRTRCGGGSLRGCGYSQERTAAYGGAPYSARRFDHACAHGASIRFVPVLDLGSLGS